MRFPIWSLGRGLEHPDFVRLAFREGYLFVGRGLNIFPVLHFLLEEKYKTRKVKLQGPDLTTNVTGGISNTNFDCIIHFVASTIVIRKPFICIFMCLSGQGLRWEGSGNLGRFRREKIPFREG